MKEIDVVPASERLIDIEALFASKNPKLLKLMPRFIISYLKRITHQDTVNAYVYRHRDKFGRFFAEAILREFGVKVKVAGKNSGQLIPEEGRFIIVANHPLGGIDGMALIQEVGKIHQDIIFPVNDLLLNLPGLRPVFVPINKHGNNKENVRLIDETFASDKTILYFPAGLVSRKQKIGGKSVIRDLEWKNTFVKKAKKYRRDVIPVYIDGRNSDWFYNLSLWRKRFGIGANIEMLYLVDEMMKQLNKTITLVSGDPVPYTAFDSSRTEAEWADLLKDQVYRLKDETDLNS